MGRRVIEYAKLMLPFWVIFISCETKSENNSNAAAVTMNVQIDSFQVAVEQVKRGDFPMQIQTNGKIRGEREAPLTFPRSGIVEHVYFKNGSKVRSGQIIASLYNQDLKLSLQRAELGLAESLVEIDDLLISQGGKRGDTLSVSKEVFKYIQLKSGYKRAKLEIQKCRNDIESTYLRSPIDGLLANLDPMEGKQTLIDKPFCQVISRESATITCKILETELSKVFVGQYASIEPTAFKNVILKGKIVEINPIVDEHSLINVTISVTPFDQRIVSGMNVRVLIERVYKDQLFVKKSAVVDRNGKKVVFTLKNNKAFWNYVKIGIENYNSITILDGLSKGDTAIVSGNLSLGHGARVRIKNVDYQ